MVTRARRRLLVVTALPSGTGGLLGATNVSYAYDDEVVRGRDLIDSTARQIQLTSPPISQVAPKRLGGSQRSITPLALPCSA